MIRPFILLFLLRLPSYALALAPSPNQQPSQQVPVVVDESPRNVSRRTIIQRILATSTAPALIHTISTESVRADDQVILPNLSCLEDLPPVQPNTVRIFLCRHGQTENNRLRKVQGARVNPPLNNTGRRQALRMGETLSNYFRNENVVVPKLAIHSNLLRAIETAKIVSLTMGLYRDPVARYDPQMEESDFEFLTTSLGAGGKEDDMDDSKGLLGLQTLNSLNEVDFGSLEGKSVNEAKATMMYTFGQWGLGRLDAQNDGGENGRDVIGRASQALFALRDVAMNNGGCAIAVSHSTYLRVLLAMVMDMSLIEAGTMSVNNCSIHVLDLDCKKTMQLQQSSNIFGGKFSLAPKDFRETIPVAKVVRSNEIRHLSGLL